MNHYQRWKNIMKCYPFDELRLEKWQPPYIVQPKYDGVRCRAIPVQGGKYVLVSSEENVIFSVPHINAALEGLRFMVEFDGELYCHGMSFEEIFSRTSRTVNRHEDYQSIQFYIFDIVNELSQSKRINALESIRDISPFLVISPFWLCKNLSDVMKTYDKLIEMKYEGIIIRHSEAPYQRKRSTLVMKFKPKKEDKYRIINYTEEKSVEGVPKGVLGALVCQSGDGETFSVGTGFIEDQRRNLWEVRDELPGKLVKVKYQHLTDRKVPRFPVFAEILEKPELQEEMLEWKNSLI